MSFAQAKKVAKLLHGIASKEGQPAESILHVSSTEVPADCAILCLLNVGNESSGAGDVQAIEQVLPLLAGFKDYKVARGRAFSFALFDSHANAQSAFQHLDNALFTCTAQTPVDIVIPASRLTSAIKSTHKDGRIIHVLFAKHVPFPAVDTLTDVAEIMRAVPGLHVIPDFITPEEEKMLVEGMNLHPWNHLSERQVQHHGFVFNYDTNQIDFSKDPGPLPPWCEFLTDRIDIVLKDKMQHFPGEFTYRGFNQLTLNRYPPGTGISPHADTHSRFDSPITSLSLLSPVQMEFRTLYHTTDPTPSNTHKTVQVQLPARSITFMAGLSRFSWEHGIRGRKADVVNGKRVDRELRVSMTFRGVRVKQEECVCDCGWDMICDSKMVGGAAPDRFKDGLEGVNRHGIPLK
ncbi:hypothetical protein HDU98_000502 [Podochytrium sp. JEL0797]|nr:hypothetical protein HDU98_000502 [Podochytrium sp. JEL0797]